jgi:hypothetical protein
LLPRNAIVADPEGDPGQRHFQIAEGDRTAAFNVVPFNDEVSQIMIAGHAAPGEDSTTSRVVQAVLRVEMGKHCQVGG